ncbi:MAG: helix-turn-helix transcriptional regulator [Bacteroidota bacterium]
MFTWYIKEVMIKMGRKPSAIMLRAMGLNFNTATQLVKGKAESIKLKTLYNLCTLLQCTPNDLLNVPPSELDKLPPAHPLHQLRKADYNLTPLDIVRALPIDKIEQANKLLMDLLNDGKGE